MALLLKISEDKRNVLRILVNYEAFLKFLNRINNFSQSSVLTFLFQFSRNFYSNFYMIFLFDELICYLFFSAPLASVLSQLIGPRKVALVGGIMAFGGLTVSALAPSLEFLYIFYGVVQGNMILNNLFLLNYFYIIFFIVIVAKAFLLVN